MTYTPPPSGILPLYGKKILKKVYATCRADKPGEIPARKSKCARIAWSTVRKAGYTRSTYAR